MSTLDRPLTPGRVILYELDARMMSKAEFEERAGLSPNAAFRLMTPECTDLTFLDAEALVRAFGGTVDLWMELSWDCQRRRGSE